MIIQMTSEFVMGKKGEKGFQNFYEMFNLKIFSTM